MCITVLGVDDRKRVTAWGRGRGRVGIRQGCDSTLLDKLLISKQSANVSRHFNAHLHNLALFISPYDGKRDASAV